MSGTKMNLRIRIDTNLKLKLEAVCRNKLSSQQDVVDRLVQWFVDLDETLQSVILGQIGPNDQTAILKMVLNQLLNESQSKSEDQ